jgi:hypothetical protein
VSTPRPDDVPVPWFGPRMVCTSCGIIGAFARPNWQERPSTEELDRTAVAMSGPEKARVPSRGSARREGAGEA